MQILGYVVWLVKCVHTDIFGSNHISKFLAHPKKRSLSLPARKQLFYSYFVRDGIKERSHVCHIVICCGSLNSSKLPFSPST